LARSIDCPYMAPGRIARLVALCMFGYSVASNSYIGGVLNHNRISSVSGGIVMKTIKKEETKIVTTTQYICDICGRVSNDKSTIECCERKGTKREYDVRPGDFVRISIFIYDEYAYPSGSFVGYGRVTGENTVGHEIITEYEFLFKDDEKYAKEREENADPDEFHGYELYKTTREDIIKDFNDRFNKVKALEESLRYKTNEFITKY
jgi:hypothetical protein